MNAAVAAAAAIAGVLTGVIAMLAFRWSERDQARPTRSSLHTEAVLPPGVDTVLSVLRSSAVVLDEADAVVKASSAAYALGLVRGGELAVEPMLKMARETRRDGEIRQVDLDLPRRGTGRGDALAVSARVAPLGSRLVLLLVEDMTEARRIEAVRRDFVANVSHELKTPVGALSLLSEAVLDAADDPEAVERFAGRMQYESNRLTSLVQELIDLSRVQNDDPMGDSERVGVDELMAEAVDRCRQSASSKQITLVAGSTSQDSGSGSDSGSGEDGGLYLWGNRSQLAAALGNLVENAVNYSPARTRVGIAGRRVPAPGGDLIEISVSDQGIGISERDKERVFERFYRVDPARSRATGGTGLGLAIVKHVAASHGGEVTVWSAEGQGSTFTLRLPEAGRRASRTAQQGRDDGSRPGTLREPADVEDEDDVAAAAASELPSTAGPDDPAASSAEQASPSAEASPSADEADEAEEPDVLKPVEGPDEAERSDEPREPHAHGEENAGPAAGEHGGSGESPRASESVTACEGVGSEAASDDPEGPGGPGRRDPGGPVEAGGTSATGDPAPGEPRDPGSTAKPATWDRTGPEAATSDQPGAAATAVGPRAPGGPGPALEAASGEPQRPQEQRSSGDAVTRSARQTAAASGSPAGPAHPERQHTARPDSASVSAAGSVPPSAERVFRPSGPQFAQPRGLPRTPEETAPEVLP